MKTITATLPTEILNNKNITLPGNDGPFTVEGANRNSILKTFIAGRDALQFTLNYNDRRIGGNKRTELGWLFGKGAKEETVSFGLLFPASYEPDTSRNSLMDFHAIPDKDLGEDWVSSPIVFFTQNDHLWLHVSWDKKPVTSSPDGVDKYEGMQVYDLGPIVKEKWVDWKIRVKFGYDNTGELEVWKSGKIVISRLNQPNSYNDKVFPTPKFGLYIWDWDNPKIEATVKQRVVYFSNWQISLKP